MGGLSAVHGHWVPDGLGSCHQQPQGTPWLCWLRSGRPGRSSAPAQLRGTSVMCSLAAARCTWRQMLSSARVIRANGGVVRTERNEPQPCLLTRLLWAQPGLGRLAVLGDAGRCGGRAAAPGQRAVPAACSLWEMLLYLPHALPCGVSFPSGRPKAGRSVLCSLF